MKLKYWRTRFSLDTPFGMHASFTVGNNGITSVDIDDKTGVVYIERDDLTLVIQGEGFGVRAKEPKRAAG